MLVDDNGVSKEQEVLNYDELKPTFDIFLQILLSQFLNSDFLPRIRELQDDYFKPALEFVESLISQKYEAFNEICKFAQSFKSSIDDKPKLEISQISDEMKNDLNRPRCQVKTRDNNYSFI